MSAVNRALGIECLLQQIRAVFYAILSALNIFMMLYLIESSYTKGLCWIIFLQYGKWSGKQGKPRKGRNVLYGTYKKHRKLILTFSDS